MAREEASLLAAEHLLACKSGSWVSSSSNNSCQQGLPLRHLQWHSRGDGRTSCSYRLHDRSTNRPGEVVASPVDQ